MKFATNRVLCFLSLFWGLATTVHAHEDDDIAVQIVITLGYPKNGANCTEDEKQLIMNTLGPAVRDQHPDGSITAHGHSDNHEWCESLCFPRDAIFCKVFERRCKQSDFKRRRLGRDAEIGDIFSVGPAGLRRRDLQETYDFTAEQEEQCADVKNVLFGDVRRKVGPDLSTQCRSMMQQLVRLECFPYEEPVENHDTDTAADNHDMTGEVPFTGIVAESNGIGTEDVSTAVPNFGFVSEESEAVNFGGVTGGSAFGFGSGALIPMTFTEEDEGPVVVDGVFEMNGIN